MTIKNTGKKILGFGKLAILPGEIGVLPEGFDANHPTVAYYIKKKWIEETEDAPGGEDAEATDAADLEKEIRAVKNMNLEALKAKARELGFEFGDTVTKAVLIEKITAVLTAEK